MQGTSSLFITDPLSELNPKKDTTIVWMQEAYEMGSKIPVSYTHLTLPTKA